MWSSLSSLWIASTGAAATLPRVPLALGRGKGSATTRSMKPESCFSVSTRRSARDVATGTLIMALALVLVPPPCVRETLSSVLASKPSRLGALVMRRIVPPMEPEP